MDSEKITAFVQEHWNIILIMAGAPQSHRYGRSARSMVLAGR